MGTAVRAKYQHSERSIAVAIRLGQIYSGGIMRIGTGQEIPVTVMFVAWSINF